VTRGRLPQRAGSPSLNGGGAAAAVPRNVFWLEMPIRVPKFSVLGILNPKLVVSGSRVGDSRPPS